MIKKEDWLTIPNILSYIRILMIPLYVYLYVTAEELADYYWAAGLLVLSALTDALDGVIARKTGQITDLGKVIDPVADKLTQVAVVGAMLIVRPYIYPLLILFVLKELFLLINSILLYRKDIMMDGSMWFGKVATAVFYISMFILVIFPTLDRSGSMPLIIVTAIFQIITLFGYGNWYRKMFQKNQSNEDKRME